MTGAPAAREAAPEGSPLVVLRDITKRFPGVVANDHVDLSLREGEIHALVGENGAGKSTLMRVLYGLYAPDGGEILVRGEPVRIASPRDAIARGIGMVHQHFMLVAGSPWPRTSCSAREGGPILDRARAEERIRELADAYGFVVDPAQGRRVALCGRAAARRDPEGALSRARTC